MYCKIYFNCYNNFNLHLTYYLLYFKYFEMIVGLRNKRFTITITILNFFKNIKFVSTKYELIKSHKLLYSIHDYICI